MPLDIRKLIELTAVNVSLIPDTDDAYDIGSSSFKWKDLYVDGTAYIDAISVSGNITIGDDSWIGIGVTSPRIVFDDTGGKAINFQNAGFYAFDNAVQIADDNIKLFIGLADDVSLYFDASDLIINSENVTANDEIHFTNFDAYLFDNKVTFTQVDGNEYIDSLNDGYMDYGATTAHRFLANIEMKASDRRIYFGASNDSYISNDGSALKIVGQATPTPTNIVFTSDKFEHASGTFDLNDDNLTTTGDIRSNTLDVPAVNKTFRTQSFIPVITPDSQSSPFYFERAASPLTTPTSDATGDCLHPDVVYIPGGWNGYTYWMVMTPFFESGTGVENPEILVSNDGTSWSDPGSNPIAGPPATSFYPDPTLMFDNDTLYCYWPWTDTGGDQHVLGKSSTDGVNWSAEFTILTVTAATDGFWSPIVRNIDGTYYLWVIDSVADPNTFVLRTSSTPTGTFASAQNCTYSPAGNEEPFHASILWDGDVFYSITKTTGNQLLFARSYDGITWAVNGVEVFGGGGSGNWDEFPYQTTLIKRPRRNYFDTFYSAIDGAGTPAHRIGRAKLHWPIGDGTGTLYGPIGSGGGRSYMFKDTAIEVDHSIGAIAAFISRTDSTAAVNDPRFFFQHGATPSTKAMIGYDASADTFNIGRGGLNLNVGFSMDASGNVDLGSVIDDLVVFKSASGALGPELFLLNTGGGVGDISRLTFASGAIANDRASIRSTVEANPWYGTIEFWTGNTGLTKKLHVSGAGNFDFQAGNLTTTGNIFIGPDTDFVAEISRMKLGNPFTGIVADWSGWAHYDQMGLNTYAFAQSSVGLTIANAPTGQTISFRINNDEKFSMTVDSFDVTEDNDSIRFGAANDATITFDGDSLNIVANAVTSGDTLNLTAASFNFNSTPVGNTFIGAQLAATDDIAFNMDGVTNDYTGTGGDYKYCMQFRRDLNVGDGNFPTSFVGGRFQVLPKHTDGVVDSGTIVVEGVLGNVEGSGTWSLDGGVAKNVTQRGLDAVIADTATYDNTGTAQFTNYQVGVRAFLNLDQTYTDTSTSNNRCYAYGLEVSLNNNPTLSTGTLAIYNRGISVDVVGTTVGGQYNYGLYISRVSGADGNWGIYDASGADWILDGDDQKIISGEGQDFEYFFDGTYGRLDATGDPIRIGDDTTNCAQIAADGELTLLGTARTKVIVSLPATTAKGGGTAPTPAFVGDYPVLQFSSAGGVESIHYAGHIPTQWAAGTDITIHIHWAPTDANAGDVVWDVDYVSVQPENNELLTAATSNLTTTDSTQTLQDEMLQTAELTISGAGLAQGDIVSIKISRDTADGADTYGSSVSYVIAHIEYVLDKLGRAT